MATLAPAPSSLGLWSPQLAPWFSTDVSLPAADDTLSVALTGLSSDWLPPTRGLLSLLIATSPRPALLAPLRRPDGSVAFTDGAVVALFRVLSEVEERLQALSFVIPSASGATSTTGTTPAATRPRVRYLALELAADTTVASLGAMVAPAATGSEAEIAATLGLKLSGTTIENGDQPMRDMKAPRLSSGTAQEKLLAGTLGEVRLWAFDASGHAIDPGAVASWWSYLATTAFGNLWADDIGPSPRTASSAAALTAELVNAHGGPLADPVLSRLTLGNAEGTGTIRTRASGTGALTVAFGAAPSGGDPDDAPVPLVALLPDGRYDAQASAWPNGAVHATLARDQVRIAALDVEAQLVGQPRVGPSASTADSVAARRAGDQARASTRVHVSRTVLPTLLARTDDVAGAASAALPGGGTVGVVAGVLDRDWGPISLADHPLPNVSPPARLLEAGASLMAAALTGGGPVPGGGGVVTGQSILLDIQVGAAQAGAWVRVWALGFDSTKGIHYKLDGGSGRVRADGHALLVSVLPDGTVDAEAQLGFDVIVVTAQGSALFADERCARPTPIGGTPVAIGAAGAEVVVCETGVGFSAIPAAGSVPPGSTLVARSTPPALVDRTSLAASAFSATSLLEVLPAGAKVQLTAPAFRSEPDGDTAALSNLAGATITRQTRNGLARLGTAGAPLPTMERLELALSRVGSGVAQAAVGSTPALSRYHELLPHQLGHPGAPAAVEIHGAGAALNGPAAVQVAEYVRGRTAGDTAALARATFSAPFTDPPAAAKPTAWAAVLATVAAEVEAEDGVAELIAASGYTLGGTLDQIRSALSGIVTIPSGLDAQASSVMRALDRRMLAAARGLREGATSMCAAIARAEDFVYLETPAFDDLIVGAIDDELSVYETLRERMDQRPGLQVVLCLPVHLLPGMPNGYIAVRNKFLTRAVADLRTSGKHAPRIAVFSPSAGPGRTLRLASTSLIVDDAYALTGTTHGSRRGLSFDSSLAVAVFDETLENGRPAEIRRFRRALLCGRLGLTPNALPEDPADLVAAIQTLATRGGGTRLATDHIVAPIPPPTETDAEIWDRDGSLQAGFDPVAWLTGLAASVEAQLVQEAEPAP
jgi:hypothetical protein